MRIYEELFILKPDTPDEEVDAYIEQMKGIIVTGKGTVDKVDSWGIRKLAYRVAKHAEGRYVLIQFTSDPDLVHEVERRMRVSDQVIKFITVRIDEKLKKIEKRKKIRDKRAARRPAPAPMATPSAPAPTMPSEPAANAPGLPGAPAPAVPAAPAAPATPAVAASTETKEKAGE
jgi:small subunit ribosomal protein S6